MPVYSAQRWAIFDWVAVDGGHGLAASLQDDPSRLAVFPVFHQCRGVGPRHATSGVDLHAVAVGAADLGGAGQGFG